MASMVAPRAGERLLRRAKGQGNGLVIISIHAAMALCQPWQAGLQPPALTGKLRALGTRGCAACMPQAVTDQRVVAVYCDQTRHVERIANYGMKDGKIFDYVSRTTATGGQEMSYLTPLFRLLSNRGH